MSHWSWQTSSKWLRSEPLISVEIMFPSRSVMRSQIRPNGRPVTWLRKSPSHLLSLTKLSALNFTGILTAASLARYFVKLARFRLLAATPLLLIISDDSANGWYPSTRTNWFVFVYLKRVSSPLCHALGSKHRLPMTFAGFRAQFVDLACRPTPISEPYSRSRTAS